MGHNTQSVTPAVGEWYLDSETHEEFKVVGMDEESGCLEVQYLNGEIGELEKEEWGALELSRIGPPEDWSLALEPLEDGDAGYDEESWDASPPQIPNVEDGNLLLPDEGEARPHPPPGRRGH